jgi:hypothetical protein
VPKIFQSVLFAALLWFLAAFPAQAQQSSPGWTFGYVPTPAEWNFWWGKKVDWAGAGYCPTTGCTFTGAVTFQSTLIGSPNLTFTGPYFFNAGGNNSANIVVTGGLTTGDTNQGAQIKLTNTNAGLSKSIRVNVTGGLDILNDAYSTALLNITDAGVTNVNSPTLTVDTNVLNINASGGFRNILRVVNNVTTNNAGARLSVSTGTANVYGFFEVNNLTASPTANLSIGPGVTNGLVITAAAGSITLNPQIGIGSGGTGATTQQAAFDALAPTATRAGDVTYWNGTHYVNLAGNNSGTQFLSENSSGVPSWSASSSATTLVDPQGRLTLQANSPVMVSSQSAQTTLRYDCYIGNQVPYFNGSIDQLDTISTCEVTDAMISAASARQVVSGNVYDVWWVHGGANRICLAMSTSGGGGGGWSADTGGSNTARGTGYSALDRTTRPYTTNANAIANCFNGATNYGSVSAHQGTYLGTVYASANGQISYNFGTAASGGGAGLFGVWNMYNRRLTTTVVTDNGATYTYTSSTVRQARASAGNQVQFVLGLGEDGILVSYAGRAITANAASAFVQWGVGFDTTSTYSFQAFFGQTQVAFTDTFASSVSGNWQNGLFGLHTVSANENSDNTNANTFDSASGNGLMVSLMN